MHSVSPGIFRRLTGWLALMITLSSPCAIAGGGHGGGGPEPMTFTVNLGNAKYLQFGLIFETGSPEAEHELTVYRPRIQHEIILLLSNKDPEKMTTLQAKRELIEEIIELANHVIHEDEKHGVKEILYTKFLIQ